MDDKKYIGMDVHQSTISAAVRDANGKLVLECILETKAATIVDFIRGLTGTLYVTFEGPVPPGYTSYCSPMWHK